MDSILQAEPIVELRNRLSTHPIYGALRTPADLRCFMAHHVYSVWDFMSVIKYLQARVASATVPWVPQGDAAVKRLINELVLEEETDEAPPELGIAYCSHFELYLAAMREVEADTGPPARFIEAVATQGLEPALGIGEVPEPARRFVTTTFGFLGSGKPHEAAAALALGREHIIPEMFRALLLHMGVTSAEAPAFHYYLNRHVHLDEDFHAPLSLRLLAELCGDDPVRQTEAQDAAQRAIEARLAFWDGVHAALIGV